MKPKTLEIIIFYLIFQKFHFWSTFGLKKTQNFEEKIIFFQINF